MYNMYQNQNQPCCPYPYEQPEPQLPPPQQPMDIVCWCSDKVLCFLSFLFALALGLILGSVFAAVFIVALPALIILAVVLLILIIAVLIIKRCKCCKRRCC